MVCMPNLFHFSQAIERFFIYFFENFLKKKKSFKFLLQ